MRWSPLLLAVSLLQLFAAPFATPAVAETKHAHPDAEAPEATGPGGHAAAHARPDDHAPIGVMGDHLHHAGDVMLSYRYGRMRMAGNRSSTRKISRSEVLADFPIAPTDMDVDVHMVGLMWAPFDSVTLMAMLPFMNKRMDHVNRTGGRFTTGASGPGDLKLTGLIGLWKTEGHSLHLNAGLSFPTGSIDRGDDVLPPGAPAPMRAQLPYPMQLGSGTFDAIPGLTYQGQTADLSWGGQALGTLRMDQNGNDYRLGDRVDASVWLARPWTPWLSTSLRTAFAWWGDVRGEDPNLNRLPNGSFPVPTADPDRRAGWRFDFLAGINLLGPKGHRLAFEFGVPMAQHLAGPQLEQDWRLMVGWQKAFSLLDL